MYRPRILRNALDNRHAAAALAALAAWNLGACQPHERLTGSERHRETAGAGVVVERIGEASALARAGVRAGDVLRSWRRLPDPPANSESGSGEIHSIFDWLWLEIEQAPRGAVELAGWHGGETRKFQVSRAPWEVEVRPRMPPEVYEQYLAGQASIEAGHLEEGISSWKNLVRRYEVEELSRCWGYLQMGDAWAEAQAWDPAQASYQEALEEAVNPQSKVAIWNAIGRAFQQQNDFMQAREAYETELEIWKSTWGKSLGLAEIYKKIGLTFWFQGNLDAAREFFSYSFELANELAPKSLLLGNALMNLGIVALARGELDAAEDDFRRALEVQQEVVPVSPKVAGTLNNLGVVAYDRGDLDLAEDFYERALDIKKDLAPDSLDVAITLTNLGVIALDRGDLDQAQARLERALGIQESLAPGSLDLADNLINLGNLAVLREDHERASDYYLRALEIQEALAPRGLGMAASLNNLAGVVAQQGNLEMAATYYHRALQIRSRLAPDSLIVAQSLSGLGDVALRANQTALAAAYFLRAIEALEAQIGKLGGTPEHKGNFRAHHGHPYRNAIEALLRLNRTREAFTVLERSRARSFLALLAERDLVLAGGKVPEELEAARRRIGEDYDRIQIRIASLNEEEHPEEIESLLIQLRRLRQRYHEVAEKARQDSPRLAALRYPRPLDPEGVRQSLDPGTVMLSYSVGKDQTDLFVLTNQDELEVVTLPVGEERLRQEVKLFRQILQEARPDSPQTTALVEVGRRLYRSLVEPVEEAVERSDRILIVPDGPLHLLPFGALLRSTPEPPAGTGPAVSYLVEWKPLHSVISGTVYAELDKSRPAPTRSGKGADRVELAAFGHPSYPRYLEDPDRDGNVPDASVRSALNRGLFRWAPLPYSRWEVETIAGLYPPANVRIYLDERATEDRVKSLGTAPRVLHFAVHSRLDDRLPLNSSLALSIPEKLDAGRDNGLLQVWEIFQSVRLDADLVVLSACSTALGQEQGGEGLIGLTRAFQYAGARSVAATLWNVDDRATAQLMVYFHRHLRAGLSKDEALRAAQMELIRGPIRVENENGELVQLDASAPFYWAAFQIFGDWR